MTDRRDVACCCSRSYKLRLTRSRWLLSPIAIAIGFPRSMCSLGASDWIGIPSRVRSTRLFGSTKAWTKAPDALRASATAAPCPPAPTINQRSGLSSWAAARSLRRGRAGTPTTVTPRGTSRVTTAPAPMKAPAPTLSP